MNQQERINLFVEEIWSWYSRHKRELPWRDMDIADDNERAYRVLVSEVMLQQTQVSRVKIVYKNFLELFPKMKDLASASNAEIIMAWRGMGYNSRALRLRDAAQEIVEEHQGVFPKEMDELLSINGIGPYTASAVRNFAFNIPTPCIDTNIRRILHRTFVGPENVDGTWRMSDKVLLEIAAAVLHKAMSDERLAMRSQDNPAEKLTAHRSPLTAGSIPQDAANWHAALMDFGSLVQTKNNPKWGVCPLTRKNIMKATPENWVPPVRGTAKKRERKEPGRFEGAKYVPNRIFRGRIVEALRDHPEGLPSDEIGPEICHDWDVQHKEWLQQLLKKLVKDQLIKKKAKVFTLS